MRTSKRVGIYQARPVSVRVFPVVRDRAIRAIEVDAVVGDRNSHASPRSDSEGRPTDGSAKCDSGHVATASTNEIENAARRLHELIQRIDL